MNLLRFRSKFHPDVTTETNINGGADRDISEAKELISTLGGTSYNAGAYRIMSQPIANLGKQFLSVAFPRFSRDITPFGYDWMGSIFAVDPNRTVEGMPGILLFEPGTGKALKIPANLVTFHNVTLVDLTDAALAGNFYDKWLSSGGAKPRLEECVGYKRPLFLSGKDVVENLEVADIDVYWTLNAQLIQNIKQPG